MPGVELGVELPHERGVHTDEAAPRPELGLPELLHVIGWRTDVHAARAYPSAAI
jgi:hypothetical protein